MVNYVFTYKIISDEGINGTTNSILLLIIILFELYNC